MDTGREDGLFKDGRHPAPPAPGPVRACVREPWEEFLALDEALGGIGVCVDTRLARQAPFPGHVGHRRRGTAPALSASPICSSAVKSADSSAARRVPACTTNRRLCCCCSGHPLTVLALRRNTENQRESALPLVPVTVTKGLSAMCDPAASLFVPHAPCARTRSGVEVRMATGPRPPGSRPAVLHKRRVGPRRPSQPYWPRCRGISRDHVRGTGRRRSLCGRNGR